VSAAGRAPSRLWRGIGLVVLVVGPLLVLGAGVAAALEVAFRLRAEVTTGRIVEMRAVSSERVRSAGEMQTRRTLSYLPVFAFTLPDGREVRAEGSFTSNPPCCAVGDVVTVRYLATDPTRARTAGFMGSWLVPVLLLVVGGGLTAMGWALRRGGKA